MPRSARAALATVLATGALAAAAGAQDGQGEWCAVSIARGATGPGGATGTLTVRNVGRPCRIVNYIVPDDRTPTARIEIVKSPAHGRADVIPPNVVMYTPKADYAGADEFHYAGDGPGRGGRSLPFRVRIQVTVVGPDAPLR
jgi:Bacterial Ig domain